MEIEKERYKKEIEKLAEEFIEENEEEITEIIKENKDKAEEDIFEIIYQEWDLISKVHEFLDGAWYRFLRSDFLDDCKTELSSCAKILDLAEEIETDKGLWEGKEPEDAIITKAFFSVRNDLYFTIEWKIKELIRIIKNKFVENARIL